MRSSQSELLAANRGCPPPLKLLFVFLFVKITFPCRYEHYDEAANGSNRSPSRKNKSEDAFSDKYFDIMDRVQELNLVSADLSVINFPPQNQRAFLDSTASSSSTPHRPGPFLFTSFLPL